MTSAGIDWQREKWQSGLGSKFIHQGEKNAAKYADEVIVLSKGVQDYFKETYGKVIANDGVMVVNDPYDKKLTVIDITDLNDPHIIFSVKTSGNPDIAYISADRIFVPLKYQGYMIIYR